MTSDAKINLSIVYVLSTAALALLAHLVLGWAWTLAAGVVGGAVAPRRGWLVGMAGVALDWAVLVGYNYVVAGASMQIMTNTLGGILGNTSGMMVVAATVFMGALLGGVGGVAGTLVQRLVHGATQ